MPPREILLFADRQAASTFIFPSSDTSRVHACRGSFFVYRRLQCKRVALRPIYISISWLPRLASINLLTFPWTRR